MRVLIITGLLACVYGAPSVAPVLPIAVATIDPGDIEAASINAKVKAEDNARHLADRALELNEQKLEETKDKLIEEEDLKKEKIEENFWSVEDKKWQAVDAVKTAEAQLGGAVSNNAQVLARSAVGVIVQPIQPQLVSVTPSPVITPIASPVITPIPSPIVYSFPILAGVSANAAEEPAKLKKEPATFKSGEKDEANEKSVDVKEEKQKKNEVLEVKQEEAEKYLKEIEKNKNKIEAVGIPAYVPSPVLAQVGVQQPILQPLTYSYGPNQYAYGVPQLPLIPQIPQIPQYPQFYANLINPSALVKTW